MEQEHFYADVKVWLWIIGGVGFLIYVIAFHQEFGLVVKLLFEIITTLNLHWPLSAEEQRAVGIVAYGVVGNFVFFNLCLFFFSQFILPVRTLKQRAMMFYHAWLYVLGWHGAAIFIESGKIHSNKGELKKELPGVVFVDGNSAVAIERLWARGAPKTNSLIKNIRPKVRGLELDLEKNFEIGESLRVKRFMDKHATARVEGPGIIFTKKDERIAGAISLGKQNQTLKDVEAKTRDGIDVLADVKASFTVGEPNKVVVVETSAEKFQIAIIKETKPEAGNKTRIQRVIEKFEDKLSEAEVDEIKKYKSLVLNKSNNGVKALIPANKKKVAGKSPKSQVVSSAIFDPERVFRAFYSTSSDPAQSARLEWTELPAKIAVDEFRTLINKENFDDLYMPKEESGLPIKKVKTALKEKILSLGIKTFELAIRRSHLNYAAIGDDINDEDKYLLLPEHAFEGQSNLLRERGIKVLDASFGDLKPAMKEEVGGQRLAYWRSVWDKYELFSRADHELEAARIRNQSRAQTQQEMIYTLSQIFTSVPHTDEALAMRIYQALEAAATEPITKKLLPADTVEMLTQLRKWLIIEKDETAGQGSTSNRGVLNE